MVFGVFVGILAYFDVWRLFFCLLIRILGLIKLYII